jgi:hypothetical protein
MEEMVSSVNEVEIGHLTIMYKDTWETFKNKYPRLYDELDYAVVKEDEKRVLIDESRLKKVLDTLHYND